MLREGDLRVECGSLHQQAEQILSGIDKMARDFGDRRDWISDQEAEQSLQRLRMDLLRVTEHMERLKMEATQRQGRGGDGVEGSLPALVSGMALGVVLGKLWGSKSSVDLLPFLVGLEVVLNPRPS